MFHRPLCSGSSDKSILFASELEPCGSDLRCFKENELIVGVVIIASRLVEPAYLTAIRTDQFALNLVNLRLMISVKLLVQLVLLLN
jgi:hypothetical protein